MTPVRALFAGLVAAILFGAGLFIATKFAGGRPHDLVPLLQTGREPFDLLCFLAAWGALVGGVLGVLTAFLAFIAPEEDDDPRYPRRGFPKGAPPILIAIGLALAYVALRCGAGPASPPIAVPLPPDPPAEDQLLGGEPSATPTATAPQDVTPALSEPPPAPVVAAASFAWPYKDPLIRNGPVWINTGAPFTDETEGAALLCGKAWVAVTGSASEEGPEGRNLERSAIRARRAKEAAATWLDAHPACGATLVFGVSLGQHASQFANDAFGAADTAYQRQVLVVSRARGAGEAPLTGAEARGELEAFLAAPSNRAALYAGRIFPEEPVLIDP